MKYFFPVAGPEKIYPDKLGRDFDSPEDAQAYAATVATDLRLDGTYQDHAVCVTDEDGNEVAQVPV
jgi:hypothetical protein